MAAADFIRVPLSGGGYTLIDREDEQIVMGRSWWIGWHRNGYPSRVYASIEGRKPSLHRLILNPDAEDIIDHINGNPLDNRRANLRICTNAENVRNRRIHRNNKCGFKGVYFEPRPGRNKPWRALIRVDRKRISLGYFATAEDAHAAYVAAAKKYHGEFANCGVHEQGAPI